MNADPHDSTATCRRNLNDWKVRVGARLRNGPPPHGWISVGLIGIMAGIATLHHFGYGRWSLMPYIFPGVMLAFHFPRAFGGSGRKPRQA